MDILTLILHILLIIMSIVNGVLANDKISKILWIISTVCWAFCAICDVLKWMNI